MPTTVSAVDGSSVTTNLPPLPPFTNVLGTLGEDSVGVSFDPVDGATDYRIYPLPADKDISALSDGTLSIKSAIYRCAGMRQTLDVHNPLNGQDPDLTISGPQSFTTVIDADDSKNTLGYVYLTAAVDRVPVYAIAFGPLRETELGWRETRPKIYTTSTDERSHLLSAGGRDDGIVFYVPASVSAASHTIYGSQINHVVAGQGWTQYEQHYFTADTMGDRKGDTIPPAPAFQALNQADGTDSKPLMAVFYKGTQSHTELLPGKARFQRAAAQGNQPLWFLQWSGISEPTTLVIEALQTGCPFQGFLSPQHVELPKHQTLYTLAELQAASSTGEVFINGQYDGVSSTPKPIARSFVKVAPKPHETKDWDWYQGFSAGTTLGPLTEIPKCNDQNCARWQTPDFDISADRIDKPDDKTQFLAMGQFLGQLWIAFDDIGSDTTGKVRFTARTKAVVGSNTYLHATMSADIVSTDRRYPQLVITDQDAPIQDGFSNPNNNTLIVQPITGPNLRIEAEAFHGLVGGTVGHWDVNNQAPEHRFVDYDNPWLSTQPAQPPFEHAGMDRMAKFDAYISTERVYLFLDDQPVGCMLFPSDVKLTGPVTYSIGDVLYHESAPDELVCANKRPYQFMHEHQCTETKRHFDDLGFKSGVPAPQWDDKLFPCLPYGTTAGH